MDLDYPISAENGNLETIHRALQYASSEQDTPEIRDSTIRRLNRKYFAARCGLYSSLALVGTAIVAGVGGFYLDAMGGPNDLVQHALTAITFSSVPLSFCAKAKFSLDKKIARLTALGEELDRLDILKDQGRAIHYQGRDLLDLVTEIRL